MTGRDDADATIAAIDELLVGGVVDRTGFADEYGMDDDGDMAFDAMRWRPEPEPGTVETTIEPDTDDFNRALGYAFGGALADMTGPLRMRIETRRPTITPAPRRLGRRPLTHRAATTPTAGLSFTEAQRLGDHWEATMRVAANLGIPREYLGLASERTRSIGRIAHAFRIPRRLLDGVGMSFEVPIPPISVRRGGIRYDQYPVGGYEANSWDEMTGVDFYRTVEPGGVVYDSHRADFIRELFLGRAPNPVILDEPLQWERLSRPLGPLHLEYDTTPVISPTGRTTAQQIEDARVAAEVIRPALQRAMAALTPFFEAVGRAAAAINEAMSNFGLAARPPSGPPRTREELLRARRSRSTGPANRRGLDGRRR